VNKWLIAGLIWIAIDVILAVIGLPAFIYLATGPHESSVSYWVSILTPTVLLFILPGGLSAAVYLLIASRMKS
jgi:hypothetical protein